MIKFDRKKHWENIYQTKELKDVSWFEPNPKISLDFFKKFSIPIHSKIIDIGGGDSLLVDHLLDLGYHDISVLDISSAAIEKAIQRLGEKSKKVKWIVEDVSTFKPKEMYDFWHDRAAFHFLTDDREILKYVEIAQKNIKPSGVLVIGTFSEQGPKKCSGIDVKQYSETTMSDQVKKYFEKIDCITVDHKTPFATEQNFIFCCFRRFKKLHI